MPIKKIQTTRDGKPVEGYKWGSSGKVYTGPNAQAKALQQARAIYASGYKKK